MTPNGKELIDWLEQRARLSSFAEEQEKFRAAAALLRAAPAEGPPEGFVMVPREPTPEMIDAGCASYNQNIYGPRAGRLWGVEAVGIYRAMLAASTQNSKQPNTHKPEP